MDIDIDKDIVININIETDIDANMNMGNYRTGVITRKFVTVYVDIVIFIFCEITIDGHVCWHSVSSVFIHICLYYNAEVGI